jgi:NhaA family Na+:H+ antiporter
VALFRSDRFSALLLLLAAGAGLVIANSPWGAAVTAARDTHVGFAAIGLDLSLGHWVKDGLLAVFFFLAAIELKQELSTGELDSPRKALVPIVAAVGGVLAPAIIYLIIARGPGLNAGWPIPTATDIAFALGVLAIAGRSLPPRIRALLLALAVIDDLIAILIIAFFFTHSLEPLPLLIAVPVILVFGWLSYRGSGVAITVILVTLGLLAWALVFLSGIHPTIAAVALGLIMAGPSGGTARHTLEPVSNVVILPLFAFVAALVVIPSTSITDLSPVFWAVLIALPVGKLVGITAGAYIAMRLSKGAEARAVPLGDIAVVAGLGGIGFTVSLLMNELAWGANATIATEGTLAVITASIVAAVIGIVLTRIRSRHYARMAPDAATELD